MPAPVHELAITPDGSYAAIATGAGKLTFIDLSTCSRTDCPLSHAPPLPVSGTHYITAVRFIDRSKVAIGVIRSIGRLPKARFFGAEVLVMTTAGQLKFQRTIDLPQPATWSPQLDVNFGSPFFTAYTRNTALFVRAGN